MIFPQLHSLSIILAQDNSCLAMIEKNISAGSQFPVQSLAQEIEEKLNNLDSWSSVCITVSKV
jgi:hypothetical protein